MWCQEQDIICHQGWQYSTFSLQSKKKIILWPEFKLCKLILILELQVFRSWVLEKKFSFHFSHTDPTSTSNMEINKSEMRIIKISKINPYGTSWNTINLFQFDVLLIFI